MRKAKPRERQLWVLNYICKNGSVDMMNYDFVDSYFETFPMAPDNGLGVDLRKLIADGALCKSNVATGMPYAGAPHWVASYRLSPKEAVAEALRQELRASCDVSVATGAGLDAIAALLGLDREERRKSA